MSERLDGECGIRSGCLAKVECICNSFFLISRVYISRVGGLYGSAYETCLSISNSTLHNLGGHGWITITQQIDLLELGGHRV